MKIYKKKKKNKSLSTRRLLKGLAAIQTSTPSKTKHRSVYHSYTHPTYRPSTQLGKKKLAIIHHPS